VVHTDRQLTDARTDTLISIHYAALRIGEVNIYTTEIDNVTDSILRRYADTGFVKYRQSPGPVGDYDEHSILLSMSPVINDCMYHNLYRYRLAIHALPINSVNLLLVDISRHPFFPYAQSNPVVSHTAWRGGSVVGPRLCNRKVAGSTPGLCATT